ncbi:esterase/lipase family protein [Corynebacterium minutissimum]|uniref:Triacylglycerol lipase n=1 Tax=Corynebacterium minutissimum TaxID=38301 RepID=A0A376CQR9_9CORY|nr:alpha/beta fold hydrolase [Corynebacterium minutissimum]QRP62098.1 alpha/beta fold hydrolase [Corynebacterium minutissimum]STC73453.1 triacylglycerol lipase precursor [Corynebacterium minutissimum]
MKNGFLQRAFLAILLGTAAPIPAHAETMETSAAQDLGINDPDCQPTGPVTEPVVLLHGTSANSAEWNDLIPKLTEQGMCVWAFDYGADDLAFQNAYPYMKGIADLESSGREIAQHIEYIRGVTGAEKVNLVGFSQGGLHTKSLTQLYGSPDEVRRVVTVGANFHGTTWGGRAASLSAAAKVAPDVTTFFGTTAGIEQLQGSDFMEKLNQQPDTAPGITYTSIYSPVDNTVTPNETSQLTAVPGADVANVESVPVEHGKLPHDPRVHEQIVWGLTRS